MQNVCLLGVTGRSERHGVDEPLCVIPAQRPGNALAGRDATAEFQLGSGGRESESPQPDGEIAGQGRSAQGRLSSFSAAGGAQPRSSSPAHIAHRPQW